MFPFSLLENRQYVCTYCDTTNRLQAAAGCIHCIVEDQVSGTMVRMQLNIFQLLVYSTKEMVYHRLQLEMVAGEGGTVFPRLHSGRSGETATGDSTWLPPDLKAMEAMS